MVVFLLERHWTERGVYRKRVCWRGLPWIVKELSERLRHPVFFMVM
jgi:hypothetical protein